ncbi:HAD family phosphatase [Piscinibacter gummiphilus]|uniref:HAD family phosphatase n=1 Tax=Piscinibacter gummiphilus TaxID=946333 RepID=A0ABZ0CMU7_9BURK|nr:HAD family phosphatase [Piscinibacter gummiphilus]WOB06303.1 HAD family phosphatase [Piscinibacter gummiphilus]
MSDALIRAVFFDYDGVLTRDKTGSFTTCRSLAQQTGLPFEAIRAALQPHNDALNLGRTTHEAIWPSVCATLKRDIPLGFLTIAFESTPLDDEVMSLARQLATRYRVGLITDNKRDRIDHLRLYQRLDAVFDPIVVSSVVGMGKDSAGIFEHALAVSGVQPQQAVFIDNSPDNLLTAAALGLHTVHFDDERRDVAALILALQRLGVEAS